MVALTFTPAPGPRRPLTTPAPAFSCLPQSASTAPKPSWETHGGGGCSPTPRVSTANVPLHPKRAPNPTLLAAYSPLVKGSIFPPPRLLTAEAPKLPTPRTEAALSTEHAQRGRQGLSGRCRERRRRSAALRFRCSGFLQQLQQELGRPKGKTPHGPRPTPRRGRGGAG